MLFQIEVAGIHTENEDGTERKNIVRRHLDPEAGKKYQPILQRERDNHHDENAIAVHIVSTGLIGASSYKIGYLDREMAKQVAHFLDSGGKVKNLTFERIWIPHNPNAIPTVALSFESSWCEEDVEYWKIESQKDEAIKKQQKKEGAFQEAKERVATSAGLTAVNEIYGRGPMIWLIALIILILWFSLT